jgi:2-oxoisovalerate dehydrogenase E1 component
MVEKLADELRDEEVLLEIVAPSLLSPLPFRALGAHLLRRPRSAVFEESYGSAGFGVSLGCALAEAGYRGRFRRLNPAPVPIPAARSLERLVLPDRRQMLDLIAELLLNI